MRAFMFCCFIPFTLVLSDGEPKTSSLYEELTKVHRMYRTVRLLPPGASTSNAFAANYDQTARRQTSQAIYIFSPSSPSRIFSIYSSFSERHVDHGRSRPSRAHGKGLAMEAHRCGGGRCAIWRYINIWT